MLKLDTSRAAAAVATAALTLSAFALAPEAARAQDHAAHGAAAPTEAETAEIHRQLTELLTLVYAHADFEAVDAHLTGLIRENAAAIGGDTDAFATHVSSFLRRVAEHATADPESAAEDTTQMLIEAHRPR